MVETLTCAKTNVSKRLAWKMKAAGDPKPGFSNEVKSTPYARLLVFSTSSTTATAIQFVSKSEALRIPSLTAVK